MIVRLFFVFLLVCTSDVHAGVLDRLDEVGDAVKPGSKDAGSSTGEMPDGPADEKFSDFVKEAHGAAKGTKYAAKGLGAVPPFKEGMPELENISKGAGKTADALKGARAIQEIEEGKRTGTSKAAELGLKYGAGKASGILAKPVTGTVEAAAQGVEKVNATLDNPTEENSAETIRHVKSFRMKRRKIPASILKKQKRKSAGGEIGSMTRPIRLRRAGSRRTKGISATSLSKKSRPGTLCVNMPAPPRKKDRQN